MAGEQAKDEAYKYDVSNHVVVLQNRMKKDDALVSFNYSSSLSF